MSLRLLFVPRSKRLLNISSRPFTSYQQLRAEESRNNNDPFGLLDSTPQFSSFGNAFDEIQSEKEGKLEEKGGHDVQKKAKDNRAAPSGDIPSGDTSPGQVPIRRPLSSPKRLELSGHAEESVEEDTPIRRALSSPSAQKISVDAEEPVEEVKSSNRKSTVPPSADAAGEPGSRELIASQFAKIAKSMALRKARAAPGDRMLNRCCLVVGGTSGIGLAVAKRFVEEGATRVIITSRSAEKGSRALHQIKESTGLADAPVSAIVLDFDSIASSSRFTHPGFLARVPEYRLCNTVVNCASTAQSQLLFFTTHKAMQRLLDLDLTSAIYLAQSFFRLSAHLDIAQRYKDWYTCIDKSTLEALFSVSPCIVNVGSLLAQRGGYGASVYAAAKAGLVAFNRAFCLEVASIMKQSPLRANLVMPGYTDTPMTKGIQGEARENLERQIPLGRFADPDEIADAILFLVTNKYANNCVLNLDGGLSAV